MAAIALLGVVLGYAALKGGELTPRDLSVCLLALGLVGIVYGRVSRDRSPVPPADSLTLCLTMALLGVPLIQLLPLPVSLIGLVSPARAELVRAARLAGESLNFTPLSLVPAATAGRALSMLACVLVFLLVREISWRHEKRPWMPVFPILAVALLEAAIGIAQHSAPESSGIALGTFENRNHYAGFLEMSLPFAVMLGVAILKPGRERMKAPARRAAAGCCALCVAAMIFLGILYSLSRMGFVAALSGLAVAGAVAIGRGRPAWRAVGVVTGTVVVLGLCALVLPSDEMISRFAPLAAPDVPADTRIEMWRDTVRLIAAYPVVGCGLGGYESGLMRYKTAAPMFTADFAHNDYLQLLAEVGVLGVIVLLCLGARILLFAWRAAAPENAPRQRTLALACLGSLAAILLHSFVDFNLYIHSNAMLLAWIGGIAAGPLVAQRPNCSGEPRLAAVLGNRTARTGALVLDCDFSRK